MAAAVPIIADVIYSVVVSKVAAKVVTEVAVAVGASEQTAAFLGSVAGIWAGSAVYGDASEALGLNEWAAGAGAGSGAGAVQGVDAANAAQNTQNVANVASKGAQASSGGGLLTSNPIQTTSDLGALDLSMGAPPSGDIAGAAQSFTNTADSALSVANAPAVTPPTITQPQSFMDKMLSSDRAADVVVGGASGMAQGYMQAEAAQEQAEAEARRQDAERERLRQSWMNADYSDYTTIEAPNFNTVDAQSQMALHQPGLLTRRI